MSDSTLMHETYRYDAETPDDAYTRSVHSFWCPICKAGRQRPNVTAALYFDDWRYECDHCRATGTRKQIENSAFYAERIPSKTCPICGGTGKDDDASEEDKDNDSSDEDSDNDEEEQEDKPSKSIRRIIRK